MSNALAIAAVTAVLKDLLNDGLINANLDAIGQFQVTSLPLDELEPAQGAEQVNRLNIYMWGASRNAAWANERLPARSAAGGRLDSPFLALDLHYVLTATGTEELTAEILLGYGMQVLHETPVLTRAAIETALGGAVPPVDAALLPPAQRFLMAADLADQFEQIRISPYIPDPDPKGQVEVLSNLWSSFSTALRASAFYQANCVLIESSAPVRTSLPVLTIGGQTAPLRSPRITRARALPLGPGTVPDAMAALTPGSWVALDGTALRADSLRVVLGDRVLPVDPANVTATRIDVQLPADITAGLHNVLIEHLFVPSPGQPERVWEMSNAAPLAIAPVIAAHSVNGAAPAGRFTGTVTIDLPHPVRANQTAALVLNPLPGAGQRAVSLRCRPRDVDGTRVIADVSDIAAADYLLRVELDGAASQLSMGPTGFNGPIVDLDP